MRELLSRGGLGLVLLGMWLSEIKSLQTGLASINLTTVEGVQEALKMQGEVKGINRMIDKMFDLAEGIE